MCQIALFKSTEKVFFTVATVVTVMTVVRKNMQPLHKKITQPFFLFLFTFSVLLESEILTI